MYSINVVELAEIAGWKTTNSPAILVKSFLSVIIVASIILQVQSTTFYLASNYVRQTSEIHPSFRFAKHVV